MQIRITEGGKLTEIITVLNPAPEPEYSYTDVDGDRVVLFTADIPDVGPCVTIATSRTAGCSIPLDQVEEFIAAVRATAAKADR